MPVHHHTVASDFRNNASSGDAERPGVAINDRRLGTGKGRDRQAVDKEVLGERRQPGDSALHS
jgi:hypothetical protein